MIYGSRIRQARELREVLQQDLAAALGVSGSRLAQIERAGDPFDLEAGQRQALSAVLRLPVGFFEVPAADGLSEGSMRFRARRTVTQRLLNRARREAELAHELARACAARLDVPGSRVPSVAAGTDVDEAAAQARAALGVAPEEPIQHMLHVMERGGVWVFLIDSSVEDKLDAFSTWSGTHLERPVVALGTGLSWERVRFTAAHELGHLVMHRAAADDGGRGVDIEREADRFAAAFLLPRPAALEELPRPVTLSQLGPLKSRWGMSIAALVMRAYDVGIVSAAHKTNLMKQLSARGWNRQEPGWDARRPEQPRSLRKMAEVVFGRPINTKALSEQVGRYASEIEHDLERYAPTPGRVVRRSPGPLAAIDENSTSNVVSISARRRSS